MLWGREGREGRWILTAVVLPTSVCGVVLIIIIFKIIIRLFFFIDTIIHYCC